MAAAPFIIVMNDAGTYYLQVEPTFEALTALAAKGVVFWGQKAIARRGVFHLALSGGSTPKALYAALAGEPYAHQLAWQHVHLWWSDERDVPSDHPDSNYKLAYDAWIGKVPIPPENVHRVPTELGAAQAAAQYEAAIESRVERRAGRDGPTSGFVLPTFDLILLGMGDDGHTASLFPGTPALHERRRLVAAQFVPKLNAQRITFTAPLINAADVVIVLVSGAGKAETLRRVLLGDYRPDVLPAQLVAPTDGKLFWMVDAAAAAQVAGGPGYPTEEFIYRRTGIP